jgi:hypothetical protein
MIDRGGFNRPSCATIGRVEREGIGRTAPAKMFKKTSATSDTKHACRFRFS